MGSVRAVLGTMTFGWAHASENVHAGTCAQLLDVFLSRGHREIDTAILYANGATEKLLGQVLDGSIGDSGVDVALLGDLRGVRRRDAARLACKVNPWSQGGFAGMGGLARDQLVDQFTASLRNLGADACHTLYLHSPDIETDLLETLRAVDELHSAGKFQVFGISNYSAWETVHMWHLCDKHGYVKPTVYQGMYNALTREVERELLPALRTLGIAFYVYNPLAAGLLTGRYGANTNEVPGRGRFEKNENYRQRFWKESFLRAASVACAACGAAELAPASASLRWLQHHSALRGPRDAVVLGASSIAQLAENLDGLGGAPLPASVVRAMDEAWTLCRGDCPKYFRP